MRFLRLGSPGPICLSVVAVALLSAGGCGGKAPAEANAALDAALKALPKGDSKTFVAAVVPAQREKVATLPEWPFFQAAKSHRIDNEFDMEVTEDSAMIMTTLYFDDAQKAFSHVYFVMRSADGKWCIDLDETIKKQRERDGADAFQAWELKLKKE